MTRRMRPALGSRVAPTFLSVVAVGALLMSHVAVVHAHATLVFGTVTIDPSPAMPFQTTTMTLVMNDPAGTPVEDAVVRVEIGSTDTDDPAVVAPFVESAPGRYRADVAFPGEGSWTLRFRDTTYRQEEARAIVTLRVGEDGDAAPPAFIFPPTATGPRSIGTWLAWLVGLPLAAGVVVTVMVLRQPPAQVGETTTAPPSQDDA